MSRRRRALLLAGLALVLGVLAASNVRGREAALRRSIGPSVPVVVARADIVAGARVGPRSLAVRRVPVRYAPVAGYSSPRDVQGLRAAVAIPAGTDLLPPLLTDGRTVADAAAPAALRAGERVADLIAHGSGDLVVAGSRVDVLVTSESSDGDGHTRLALQDAEVLSSAPADGGPHATDAGPFVAVSLRVSAREAVALAAAQNFAREIRVLTRAPGDRSRVRP